MNSRWDTYTAEEKQSIYEAVRAPGLVRFLGEIEAEGVNSFLQNRDTDAARERILLVQRILNLEKEIRNAAKKP